MGTDGWESPPAVLAGDRDVVHVWRVPLDLEAFTVGVLRSVLAPDELRRAERFLMVRDAARYVVGRAVLRQLLGRYLGLPPEGVPLGYSPLGKPVLAKATDLRFNLAHSGGLALCAVAWGRDLGIDVERVRWGRLFDQMARKYFAPSEQEALFRLPKGEQVAAFYAGWTRKEAYVKARGKGLRMGLKGFAVTLRPGEPVALLHSQEGPDEARRWDVQDLDPGEGYRGALAVEDHGWALRCWQWDG